MSNRKQPPKASSTPPADGKHDADRRKPITPIAPVDQKIGEDRDNLKSRAEAFRRRRGTT
jgi:hypothetical protein